MEDIPYQNIQFSIHKLVKENGLEGTFELIENMLSSEMKHRLLIEFYQLYKLHLNWSN